MLYHVLNVSSFFRVDQAGVICKQEGIFRVNCMDCLDRTNVVQAAVARVVMEQQVKCFPCLDPDKEINIHFSSQKYTDLLLSFVGITKYDLQFSV